MLGSAPLSNRSQTISLATFQSVGPCSRRQRSQRKGGQGLYSQIFPQDGRTPAARRAQRGSCHVRGRFGSKASGLPGGYTGRRLQVFDLGAFRVARQNMRLTLGELLAQLDL